MRAFLSRRSLLSMSVAAALAASIVSPAPAATDNVIVFAAASLKNALDDVGQGLRRRDRQDGPRQLRRRRRRLPSRSSRAAPADIFFSADMAWMDYVEKRGLIRPDTRRTCSATRIVLVAPKDSPATVDIAPGMDLAGAPRRRRPPRHGQHRRRAGRHLRQGGAPDRSASGTASPTASSRPRMCAPRSPMSRAARRRSASSTPPTPAVEPAVQGRSAPSRTTAIRRSSIRSPSPPLDQPATPRPSSTSCSPTPPRPAFEKQGFTLVAPGS